jgi:hypothetical protein
MLRNSKTETKSNEGEHKSSCNSSSSESPEPYFNIGRERFEKIRADWLKPKPGVTSRKSPGEVLAKSVDVEDIIERLFAQNGGGILPEPIPLGQMIDILIDFWEADGLYD